jgi:Flp pilus assembly protein TadG
MDIRDPLFFRNESGAIMALAALSLPILLLAVGAAVDYSRANALKTRLQNATDGAVLVAGRSASAMTDSDLLAATNKVFKANIWDASAKIEN